MTEKEQYNDNIMARDSEAMKARYLRGAKNDTKTEINGYNNSSEVNGFKMGGWRGTLDVRWLLDDGDSGGGHLEGGRRPDL